MKPHLGFTRHTPGVQAHFYRTSRPDGETGYVYLLTPEAELGNVETRVAQGLLPKEAVVLAAGVGDPDEKTIFDMELYFGIKTEVLMAA